MRVGFSHGKCHSYIHLQLNVLRITQLHSPLATTPGQGKYKGEPGVPFLATFLTSCISSKTASTTLLWWRGFALDLGTGMNLTTASALQ